MSTTSWTISVSGLPAPHNDESTGDSTSEHTPARFSAEDTTALIRCPCCPNAYRRPYLFKHIRANHGKQVIPEGEVLRIGGIRCTCGSLLSSTRGLRRHTQATGCSGALRRGTEFESSSDESSISPGFARRTGAPAQPVLHVEGPFSSEDENTLFNDFIQLASVPEPPSVLFGAKASVFTAAAATLAQQYVISPSARSMALLLSLPKLGLAAHCTRGGVSATRSRLAAFPTPELIAEALHAPTRNHQPASSSASITARDRVHRDIKQGRLRRAARHLNQSLGAAQLDDETLEKLRALHPDEPPPIIHPGASPVRVGPAQVKRAIRKLNRYSSGAISGWDAALLKLVARDGRFLEFLVILTRLIAAGTAPGAQMLRCSRGVGLRKDTQGGIRPIAVGEIFYRIAATAIGYACRQADDLLPCQFGVGTPGGVEPIVHTLEHALMRDDDDAEDVSVIKLDLKNAFNSASRARIAHATLQNSPHLVSCFEWSYGSHSKVVFRDAQTGAVHLINSAAGVRQGDPLGPYLFSLAYRYQIDRIVAALEARGLTVCAYTILAYLDDTILLVPTGQVDTVLEAIAAAFGDCASQDGFILRPDKTVIRSRDEVRESGIEVLGTCIGSPQVRAAFLEEKLSSLQQSLDSLHDLHRQDAQLLLRSCLLPKLAHLQRTLDPDGVMEVWEKHDQAIYAALQDLAGAPGMAPRNRLLAELPARFGGIGLTRAASTSSIARFASVELARWQLTNQWGKAPTELAVGQAREDPDRPPRQRELTAEIWEAKAAALADTLSDQQSAQVAANSQRLATAWLFACPIEPGLHLSDATVTAGLMLRLLEQPRGLPGACPRCSMVRPPPGHDLSCSTSRARRTRRHDDVKRLLFKMFRACGTPHITRVGLEPLSTNQPQRRADLLVAGAAAPIPSCTCLDVSVVSLSSSVSRRAIASTPRTGARDPSQLVNRALSVRFRDKKTHYRDAEFDGTYLPFVVSTEGAMHDQAADVFKTLRKFKLGKIVYRFGLLLSCALLRERAATFYSTS